MFLLLFYLILLVILFLHILSGIPSLFHPHNLRLISFLSANVLF